MVDTITLFESTETDFTTNGIGSLPDASKCIITEERNGEYELEMEYPITGHRYSDLKLRRIIFAKPNPYSDRQPFRIYKITKPIEGIVTVYAEHVRYDLSGYVINDVTAYSATSAINMLLNNGPVIAPFTAWSNVTTAAQFTVDSPVSVLSRLGGNDGSVLDVYGGEYEWDCFNIKLWESRGEDRGVTIRYGKNLTDLQQEENCSEVFTGIYPYWTGNDSDGNEVTVNVSSGIVNVDGEFDFVKIAVVDFTSEFDSQPTPAQLQAAAEAYIIENDIGIPEVTLTVSFVQLSQSEEYKDYKLLETVKLCDTVTVQFEDLGVDATSKVVSTTYDVLTDKYTTISLGSSESSFTTVADTIAKDDKKIEKQITKSMVEQIADHTSKLFNGCFGGYVRYNYVEGQEEPYEILIMDNANISSAKNIWRWNYTGLAFSKSGYNGPWIVGMNMLGEINGEMIAAGTINGDAIESGTISTSDLSDYENIATKSDIANMGEYYESGQLWMRFDKNSNTGLWIGRLDSQFAVNITNTRMAFVQASNYASAIDIDSSSGIVASFIENTGETTFLVATNSKANTYVFTYNGTVWRKDNINVTLSSYGIQITGTPVNGSTITVVTTDVIKSGQVVAYVSNEKLMIERAHLMESLYFGKNTESGSDVPEEEFAFIPNTNGSLKFKWVGEEEASS